MSDFDAKVHLSIMEFMRRETAGIKSKVLSFMPCTPHRLQANNVIGDREPAEDVEMSDAADMESKLLSFIPCTLRSQQVNNATENKEQRFAESARRRRERIRQEIEGSKPEIVPSSQGVPTPKPDNNIVYQLSNPAFKTKLPFPFVGDATPNRFDVDNKTEEKSWFYMGREKFAELIREFEHIRSDSGWTALIVYGTRGYGKSHLLAALVCYLAAREEKVVYIPDCREFLDDPVPYMRAAMLFAWTDNEKQQNIMALKTEEDIYQFFQEQDDVIFVINQLNALDKQKTDDEDTAKWKTYLHRWLNRFRASHKAILSSSANNQSMLNAAPKQSSKKMIYVHGGFT